MSGNVIHFPRLRKLRRAKAAKPASAPSDRFREVTARRLRAILARVLEVLDSLEQEPRRQ